METGTIFFTKSEGYSMSGSKNAVQKFQVVEILGTMNCCQLLYDSSIPKVNPEYREFYSDDEISQLQKIGS